MRFPWRDFLKLVGALCVMVGLAAVILCSMGLQADEPSLARQLATAEMEKINAGRYDTERLTPSMESRPLGLADPLRHVEVSPFLDVTIVGRDSALDDTYTTINRVQGKVIICTHAGSEVHCE